MTVPTVLFIFALALAVIAEVRAQGLDITAWAVMLIAIGLLWGVVIT